MPAQRTWFLKLPEILESLRSMSAPVVDRALFEGLFGVRRRRAIQLLNGFGGFQSGRTYLVDRLDLIRQIEALLASGEYRQEHRRKQRLCKQLEVCSKRSAAAGVRVPVTVEDCSARPSQLPAGVKLERGRLAVEFAGAEDLMRKLFILAQAAVNDFEGFRAVAESSPKAC
jgi:hypothetical protein